jgi:hypothetical protein
MQLYTVYFICKLLYMFRVVSPPIIRAQITVFTASGTSQPLLLSVAMVEELRLRLNSSTIATGFETAVVCAPNDG